MTSQSSQTGGKSAPLEVKVFFLVTLFSAMLIYTTNQTIIGPIIDTIDSAFSQSISQPVSQSISQSGDVRILDMKKYRETRGEKFDSWFGEGEKIIANADNNGTILDFAIVGMCRLVVMLICYKTIFTINIQSKPSLYYFILFVVVVVVVAIFLSRICKMWNY